MKKILSIILLSFSLLTCKAQNQYPLYLAQDKISGAYYKDVDNDLNKFQGTWRYTNGTTTLTIVLKKKTQTNTIRNFKTDLLVGEYSFIYNGTQQANTLNSLEQNATTYGANTIYATIIRRCDECPAGKRNTIIGTFNDPVMEHFSSRISLNYYMENGVEKLKIILKPNTYAHTEDLPPIPSGYEPVPMDSYVLTKQP